MGRTREVAWDNARVPLIACRPARAAFRAPAFSLAGGVMSEATLSCTRTPQPYRDSRTQARGCHLVSGQAGKRANGAHGAVRMHNAVGTAPRTASV